MANNPFLSGRIPPELYAAVESRSKASGKSKTEIMIRALSQYLKIPVPTSDGEITKEMYDSLVERIVKIEQSLNISKSASHPYTRRSDLRLEYLTNKELEKISNISDYQIEELQVIVVEKAENNGYKIESDIYFPEDIEVGKQVIVQNAVYKLLCMGLGENAKPLWKLIGS